MPVAELDVANDETESCHIIFSCLRFFFSEQTNQGMYHVNTLFLHKYSSQIIMSEVSIVIIVLPVLLRLLLPSFIYLLDFQCCCSVLE